MGRRQRMLISGNEAVALAAFDAGAMYEATVRVEVRLRDFFDEMSRLRELHDRIDREIQFHHRHPHGRRTGQAANHPTQRRQGQEGDRQLEDVIIHPVVLDSDQRNVKA